MVPPNDHDLLSYGFHHPCRPLASLQSTPLHLKKAKSKSNKRKRRIFEMYKRLQNQVQLTLICSWDNFASQGLSTIVAPGEPKIIGFQFLSCFDVNDTSSNSCMLEIQIVSRGILFRNAYTAYY